MKHPHRLAVAAFAGITICAGDDAHSAFASEGLGRAVNGCPILAPNFAPSARARPDIQAVRFPGGAKRFAPVATPCPRNWRPLDA